MLLTAENYKKGFLIDEELMGGVSDDEKTPGKFIAFVLNHAEGNYLGRESCDTLSDALELIAQVKREWKYESTSGCGGGKCSTGACGTGECPGLCGDSSC